MIERSAGSRGMAGQIQSVGHQGGIARPHIRIGVPVVMNDVRVVGGEDAPLPVDLGPHDDQAAAIELPDCPGQLLERR